MSTEAPARIIGLVVGALTISGIIFGAVSYVSGSARATDVMALEHRVTVIETQYPEILRRLEGIASELDKLNQLAWSGKLAPAEKGNNK